MTLGWILGSTLPVLALVYAARQSAATSRQVAQAWGILAFAQLLFIVILVVELGVKLDLGLPDSLVYAPALCYYPLLLWGVLSLPTRQLTWVAWWKAALDLAIVLLSATLLLWNYWLRPLMAAAGVAHLDLQLYILAYPIGHLVLLWALLLRLYRRRQCQPSTPLYLLTVAIGLSILSDFNFGYHNVVGTYAGGGWLDLGWMLCSLIIGLAGIWQATTVQPTLTTDVNVEPESVIAARPTSWLTYAPYLFAFAAFLMLKHNHARGESVEDSWLFWGVELIISLVVARQIFTIQENAQINRALQVEIAERKKIEAQLAHDALHDALTGLPNRVLFMDRLRHAVELAKRRSGQHFSLLFLDLDHFKGVNDSLGHTIGDQLLVGIAQRLRLCLRAGDTVARLGGDEFVVLLEDTTDVEQATATANRIQATLQQPLMLEGHQIFTTASIGIIANADGYDRPDEALRDADIAMYQAKNKGKARSELFSINLREQVQTRQQLENDLHGALERGELELHYQPILALEAERITGFEALLRWHHPALGSVSPAEFIPIAEETGLIVPIGQWVLREACRQLREWQARFPQTPPLTMNINISGKQFATPDFITQVQAILHEVGLNPTTLRLELTESVWLNSTTQAVGLFQALSKLGIQLHIDDFGTGYSSLAYLQHFPIRTLKIDQVFLNKMEGDNNSRDLVRAVIAMAHNLGMEAVAEGVETVEQLNQLKHFGCNYGQGFLLSRPVSQAGIEELLQKTFADPASLPKQRESFRAVGAPLREEYLVAEQV